MRLRPAVLAALAVVLLAPDVSEAAFPGANGKIAFVRGDDIWTMNPDGTGQVNLTNSAATEDNPAWSPDGNRIAFDSDVSGQLHLYVMLADGSAATQVTRASSRAATTPGIRHGRRTATNSPTTVWTSGSQRSTSTAPRTR